MGVHVKLKLEEIDDEIKDLNDNEIVLQMKGTLEEVQMYFTESIERIYKQFPELENEILKQLIPNNYVMNLIGAKGSKIKEIAARASAA